MDSPEITHLKKRLRYSNIIIAVLILVSLGFFFYGMINNFRMKQERQTAIEAMTKSENAVKEVIILKQQLDQKNMKLIEALKETRLAKDLALLNAERALRAERNASKK